MIGEEKRRGEEKILSKEVECNGIERAENKKMERRKN